MSAVRGPRPVLCTAVIVGLGFARTVTTRVPATQTGLTVPVQAARRTCRTPTSVTSCQALANLSQTSYFMVTLLERSETSTKCNVVPSARILRNVPMRHTTMCPPLANYKDNRLGPYLMRVKQLFLLGPWQVVEMANETSTMPAKMTTSPV